MLNNIVKEKKKYCSEGTKDKQGKQMAFLWGGDTHSQIQI
uniref:Uncharacterized protein n=1 Tax=Arundo donax TaxID=35708 RepID=A0A0A9EIW8_ARUDO